MGWSGGTYTRNNGTYTGSTVWASEAGDGDAKIKSTNHDTHDQDLATGINACLTKDGSNAATADLDAGGFSITNLAAGAATGESTRWDETPKLTGGLTLNGTTISLEYNDGTSSDLDIASVGSAGEMTLTTAQTVTGKKTFTTAATVFANTKINGPVYRVVSELTAGGSVAVDTTAYSSFWLTNDQAMTLTFTWPAASSDTDLGANFKTEGEIQIRNSGGGGALTLAHATAVTDSETIGSRPTGATEIYTLHYQCTVIGSSRYVQFTWVAS